MDKKTTIKVFDQPITKQHVPESVQCPKCLLSTINKLTNSWVARCKQCNLIYSFFAPTSLQQQMLNDPARIIIMMTSFGSGKTTLNAYRWANHLRKYSGALVIACAQTKKQMEDIIQKELKSFFLEDELITNNKGAWSLKNNSRIVFVSDKNEEGIRSGNASGIWMVEASGCNEEWYYEGLKRMRNPVAKKADGTEDIHLVIETNPTNGWVKDLVFSANQITITPKVKGINTLQQKANNPHSDIVAYLSTIDDNPYAMASFIQTAKSTAKQERYDRELYLDLSDSNSLVYDAAIQNKNKISQNLSPYNTDPNTVFVESLDPGGSDALNNPTAYILGRFNKQTKVLEILAAWVNRGTVVTEDTNRIWETREYFTWERARSLFFTGDTALNNKSKQNRNTLRQMYEERLCISIDNNKIKVGGIKTGIGLVKQWFQANKIIINTTLTEDLWSNFYTYREVPKTKFDKTIQETVTTYQFAGEDDLCDALKYLIVKLNEYFPIDQNQTNFNTQWINNQVNYQPKSNNPAINLWKKAADQAFEKRFQPKSLDINNWFKK